MAAASRAEVTLVAGLGNVLRGDDGVGIHVVRRLRARPLGERVALEELGTVGPGLLELVLGYRRLIVIDAIQSGAAPGTIHELRPEALLGHADASTHSGLASALALAAELGVELPPLAIVAVEVAELACYAEGLTPEVEGAVEAACEAVEALLRAT